MTHERTSQRGGVPSVTLGNLAVAASVVAMLAAGPRVLGHGPFVGIHGQDVMAVEGHTTGSHLVTGLAHYDAGKGRFAGSVGPHHDVHLAGTDREVDAVEDLCASSAGPQPLDDQSTHGTITTIWPSSTRAS